jgi:small subunit ribosomal protein S1
VEAASNGKADDPVEETHDASGPADADASQPRESAAPAGAVGEKKRRRRRRKKRTGAQAGGEGGASEPPEAASDVAPPEGAEQPEGEGLAAEKDSAPSPAPGRGQTRDRKRERKHGPARERPPVNGGDIVFAKILEITDEAIIVDIPGKAHAIFDRREMLLPDDDEPARRPRPQAGPEEVSAEPPAGEDVAGEPHAQQVAAPENDTASSGLDSAVAGAANVSPDLDPTGAAVAESAPNGLELTVAESAAVPSALEHAPAAAPAAEEPPAASDAPSSEAPRKEPKVPRVILEIGADFIGVVHNDGARGGLVVLTHHPNRAERAKPVVEKAFQEKTTIAGLVTGVIKGGIEVDVDGLRAFAPGSHVDMRMGADLSHLVAQRLPFFVTEYAKRGRDIVLSRKSIVEEEARKARTEALAKLKVGEELDGIVRSVVPFGAFVDVGGIEGLVPLQEMSHNRADGPSDVFKAGEPTRVQVIKVDDRGKIWLSRKATIPDPWQKVAEKYAQGTRHSAKVVRLQPFGAFVELEPGVDGLIHTQDLSIKRIETPGDVVKVGDAIDVVVANIDPMQHKIALHPAPQGDQVNEAPQRVAPHKPVKVRVVAIESGGLVVRVLGVTGRNARGYITSAGTGTPRGTELRKAFHVGQDVDAKIVEVDPRRGEVKLSIKALSEEQERSAYQQYRQQLKAEARFTLADLITKKSSR